MGSENHLNKPNSKGHILEILSFLQEYTDEDHPVTTTEIITYLKEKGYTVTAKTLKDDVSVLQEYDYDIIVTNHGDNEYFLGERALQTTEIKLLVDAVASSRALSEAKSEELIEKIIKSSSIYQRKEQLPQISLSERPKPLDNRIYYGLDTVMCAIKEKHQISFKMIDYDEAKLVTLKNDGEEYILSPYVCIWNDDAYYIIGYSEKHKKVTTPRLDRMQNVREVQIDAIPKSEGIELSDFTDKVFKMYDGPIQKVELLCKNSLMKNVIDRFGRDLPVENVLDTQFKDSITASVSNTFFAWVFQFAGDMKIIGPENILNVYRKLLRKAEESWGKYEQ